MNKDDARPTPSARHVLSCLVGFCLALSPMIRAGHETQDPKPRPEKPGGIGKAKLAEKPLEILGGRLTVRMPQGAKIEARHVSIMAAPEPSEHETRVVFDAGDERLVLMANESFAFAGADFEKDVKEWVAKWAGNETGQG